MAYDRQEIYRKAEGFRARRKYRKALKEYLRIIEMDPEDQQVIGRLADLYRIIGNKAEAISYYEKAADHFFNQERIDKAAPLYKQLVNLDPKTLRRYQDLGEVYVMREHVGDAIQLYKDGIRAMRGRRFMAERIQLHEFIVEHDAKDFAIRLTLAKLLRKNGEPAQAKRLLKDGLRIMKGRKRRKWKRRYRWQLFKLNPGLGSFFAYLFGRD